MPAAYDEQTKTITKGGSDDYETGKARIALIQSCDFRYSAAHRGV
jgi:hypothetical protein